MLFNYVDKINEEEDKIFGDKDLSEQERNKFDEDKVKRIIDRINNQIKKNEISKEDGRLENNQEMYDKNNKSCVCRSD